MRTPVDFDAIVVTAPNERSARAYAQEIRARIPERYCRRQDGGELLQLAVADPESARVGSGGGTLNALAELAAALRKEGRGSELGEMAALIIHSGGDSQRSPTNSVCGKAWSALNSTPTAAAAGAHADDEAGTAINTPVDLLLEQLFPLFQGVPKGSLVVASSDVLLILPTAARRPDWGGVEGVVGLATHVSAELGPNHGAYVMEEPPSSSSSSVTLHPVRRYLQKAPLARLRAEGAVVAVGGRAEAVAIDTGVVFFSPLAAAALASLLAEAPFARCTARGLDGASPSQRRPLRLELYSDVLCALSGGMGRGREEYLRMDGTPAAVVEDLRAARARLWGLLGPLPFEVLTPEGVQFGHLGTTRELVQMMTLEMPAFATAFRLQRRVGAFLPPSCTEEEEGAVVLNSLVRAQQLSLGKGAVVEHCLLSGGRVEVGEGALVSGLAFSGAWNLRVRSHMCVQEVRLCSAAHSSGSSSSVSSSSSSSSSDKLPLAVLGRRRPFVVTVLHVDDPIKRAYGDPAARVWGQPWPTVLAALGLSSPDPIWPDADGARTLWTAKLFPVLHECDDDAPAAKRWWAWMLQEPGPSGSLVVPAGAARAWREAERLSLSDVLARGEPGAEFAWRRALEPAVRAAVAARRKGALESVTAALTSLPAGENAARGGPALDAPWRTLPRADRRWLVGAVEGWVEEQVLVRPDAVDGAGASVLAAAWMLLARLLAATAPTVAGTGMNTGGGHHGLLSSAADGEADAYDARWTSLLDALLLLPSSAHEDRRSQSQQLRALRQAWTGDDITEQQRAGWLAAAAHYEWGAFRLVARQVGASVAHAAAAFEPCPQLRPGASVVATAPARVDLSGGWSDTPPISFEIGGEVTNLAVRLVGGGVGGGGGKEGDRPIGCRVVVLPPLAPPPQQPWRCGGGAHLVLRARQADGSVTEATVRAVADVLAVPQPGCPTAIVKCALRYCGIIRPPRTADDNNSSSSSSSSSNDDDHADADLAAQLHAAIGNASSGGLRIETWSALPTGSGLGTSSILVGTVLAALGRVAGKGYTRQGLIHAVLEVEQMLGVGGGWQDQVGGLLGGLQRARSPQGLPLRVHVPSPASPRPLRPEAKSALEARLLLVYTGRQRLARHMVRSVLRRYYARCPQVLETVAALVRGAGEAQRAVLEGDMEALGACLTRYWEMKKVMAGTPTPSSSSSNSSSSGGGKDVGMARVADGAGKQDGGEEDKEEQHPATASSSAAKGAAAGSTIATTDDVGAPSPSAALLSCEPAHVRRLMRALRPYTLGMSLAGAGGGGFLVCVLKEPLSSESGPSSSGNSNGADSLARLQALVGRCVAGAYVSRVAVDEEGLVVQVVQGEEER